MGRLRKASRPDARKAPCPEYYHFGCALTVLPAVVLLFAEMDEKERAVELHALAVRRGFVANSRWFGDVAGHSIGWQR